jgi:hypothetical protein
VLEKRGLLVYYNMSTYLVRDHPLAPVREVLVADCPMQLTDAVLKHEEVVIIDGRILYPPVRDERERAVDLAGQKLRVYIKQHPELTDRTYIAVLTKDAEVVPLPVIVGDSWHAIVKDIDEDCYCDMVGELRGYGRIRPE